MTQPVNQVVSRSKWHATSATDAVGELGSNTEYGLADREVETRLTEYGPNQLTEERRWVRTKRLATQFNDVLIWLLLIAAAVSGFVLDAWFDAGAIGAIVVLNAAIGYSQEAKADRALASLKTLEAPEATVLRNGAVSRVEARLLVPGDILVVEAGDLIPADARIVESIRMVANEAPLTGESIPVSKSSDPAAEDAVIGDRTSMLWTGTTLVSGRGRAVVTATGEETEMGRIAALFSDDQPTTPLQIELAKVGRRLGMVALASAVLIFGAGVLREFPIETMALTAVALAVAAIPEGLPAVVTVSLAGGLQRMAHRNAIVRRLPAVETLGAVDVICTDKTGTLTAEELKVGSVVLPDASGNVELLSSESGPARELVATAALCNDAYRSAEGLAGDPTEVALVHSLESAGIDFDALRDSYPRVDEATFDGSRKRMSTLHRADDGFVLRLKGAPEIVLERTGSYLTSSGREIMSEDSRRGFIDQAHQLASRGMRTLAFAIRRIDSEPEHPADIEEDLCFVGMVGLNERIRGEVPDAIAHAAAAGVTTVMVTGDHATTAKAVAESVGLERGEAMNGHELSEISAAELTPSIRDYRVFARVDPADKVKIIEAWKASGATVAMTGDGVNDAPALHRADIGVAMGSGTDVARESSAMVLADDNYATIVSAISEGRRLFNNLRNVVHYLLSANASEVLYVLSGFLIFGFLGEPILAVQLLWINLMSDALPAIALGMDPLARDLMKDKPGQGRDVLSGRNLTILLIQGTVLAAAAMAAMLGGTYALDLDQTTVRTMVFSTLVFSQLLHALSVRAGPGKMRRPGPLLIASLLSSAVLQLAVVYSGLGNTVFHTVPLSVAAIGWVLAASVASMGVVRMINLSLGRLGRQP